MRYEEKSVTMEDGAKRKIFGFYSCLLEARACPTATPTNFAILSAL